MAGAAAIRNQESLRTTGSPGQLYVILLFGGDFAFWTHFLASCNLIPSDKMGAEGEPPSEKDTEEIRSRIKNYLRENGQGKGNMLTTHDSYFIRSFVCVCLELGSS